MSTYPAYLLGLEGAKDKDAIVAHARRLHQRSP